jgi:death-on-curing protein
MFGEWLGPMPVLTVLGGEGGLGVLEGVLALPKQTAGGRPAYPSVFDKAAVLFRSMILDHPFVDGNKRMGVASTLVFLYSNGQVVCATDRELVTLALRVATGGSTRGLRSLSRWLERRSRQMTAIEQAVENAALDSLVEGLPGRAGLRSRPLLSAVVHMVTHA